MDVTKTARHLRDVASDEAEIDCFHGRLGR